MSVNACYWAFNSEFIEYLNLSAIGFARTNPDSKITVYADKQYDHLKPELYEIRLFPEMVRYLPMVANLHCQVDYMLKATGPVVFLDVDTLVAAEIPDPKADLTVTFRKAGDAGVDDKTAYSMPYNYGVMIANNTQAAIEAFIWLRLRCTKYHKQLQSWYGNQFALRELVGPVPSETPTTITRALPFGTLKVRIEPCDVWNYTPHTETDALEGKKIVHVKGNRKDWMAPIAERLYA